MRSTCRPDFPVSLLILVGGLLSACGSDHVAPPSTPTPTPKTNSAPVLTLVPVNGSTSCNPVGNEFGCTITFKAVASDPDGDPLTYAWTGTMTTKTGSNYCHALSPSSPDTGVCQIHSPEQVIDASVDVSDDHGNVTRRNVQVIGEGVNHPPQVRFGYQVPALNGSPTLELLGSIVDPDERVACYASQVVSASATGDCKSTPYILSSTCLEGVVIDIYRTAATGACELTVKAQDGAGLIGTTVTTIRW